MGQRAENWFSVQPNQTNVQVNSYQRALFESYKSATTLHIIVQKRNVNLHQPVKLADQTTEECGLMGKELREKSRFFVAPPWVFEANNPKIYTAQYRDTRQARFWDKKQFD